MPSIYREKHLKFFGGDFVCDEIFHHSQMYGSRSCFTWSHRTLTHLASKCENNCASRTNYQKRSGKKRSIYTTQTIVQTRYALFCYSYSHSLALLLSPSWYLCVSHQVQVNNNACINFGSFNIN